LAFPEPNLKLSDAQPFFCFKISNPNLDKRDSAGTIAVTSGVNVHDCCPIRKRSGRRIWRRDHFQTGDRVVIYTDGLTESFNFEHEMLGVDGLREIVAEASNLPSAEMNNQILNRVAACRHGHAARRPLGMFCLLRLPASGIRAGACLTPFI
jgi:Stage II sporulation protein E (SpoIIE)